MKRINNWIIFSDISDHLPIYVIYTGKKNKIKKPKEYKFIRKIHHNTINKLRVVATSVL